MGVQTDLAIKKVKGQPTTIDRPWVPDATEQDIALKLSWIWRFLSVLTIYRHGSHLIQWWGTIRTNCQYPFDRRSHVKFGENCSSFREEDI